MAHSLSGAGTPTDNASMGAINGWLKAELFTDFQVTGKASVEQEIEEYIKFFNEERPVYALGYMTPKQYRGISPLVYGVGDVNCPIFC